MEDRKPSSTPATRTTSVSSTSGNRRRRPQEFLLPDGKKILVALPEEAEALRQKYSRAGAGSSDSDIQVEVVIHGSPEHQSYLRESQTHHHSRREQLRAKYGDDFDEWERVTGELDQITSQLERLADHSASLGHNFSKFGYSANLRTYGNDGHSDGTRSGTTSSAASLSEASTEGDWNDRRTGTTMTLFKKPVIKQYFHRGLLWRSSEERSVMSFELFFDLLYVGIIAINGDRAAEHADGHELLRFVVTFCMSWKIWTDVAQLISWFETDDILSRVQMLFLIACLLGLTTNMLETFGEHYDTYTQLVAFYLAARLFMGAYLAFTGLLLPLIKGMMISQISLILVGAALWIGSIHVEMPTRVALIFVALAFDICGGGIVVFLFRYSRSHDTKIGARIGKFFEFYPAVNIEHKVERTNAFVTLVLGYSVVGVIYQNAGFGINAFLGKAVLGLIQAFVFNWLYFEVDGANIYLHAIRRHANAAFLWQYSHLVFIMSYILSAAALSKMVVATDCPNADAETLTEFYHERSEPEVPLALRLFYSTGLGIAMFSMFLISLSHRHKYPPTCYLPKSVRLANRVAVSFIFCALPAAEGLSSLNLVAITTCLTVWVLLVELWGKSCRDESFIGDKGCCYTARCSKRELDDAMKSDGEVDVFELGKGEKTAVPANLE